MAIETARVGTICMMRKNKEGEKMLFKRKKNLSPACDFLIVGLGNPGAKYERTRHNAGFLAVDLLSEQLGFSVKHLKWKALVGECRIDGARCLVMKPQTFMNNSGEAVRDCAAFYHIPPENIVVIYDDISLDVGKLRIRRKGSDGGHNGIKSILCLLNNDQFPRVKIGVGKKPHPEYELAAWVLSRFTQAEEKELTHALADAVQAVRLIVQGETERAMNQFNS